MKKITYEEFAAYFFTHLVSEISPFEEKRKFISGIIFLVMTVAIILAILAVFYFQNATDDAQIVAPVFILVLATIICSFISSSFKSKIKEKLYAKLFQAIGLKYSVADDDYADVIDKIYYICKNTGIYYRYDNISSDDIISGDYNGVPFVISDSKIIYTTGSGKNRRTVVVFNGLFLSTKIPKNFKGETIIKTDQWGQAKEIKGKKAVKLEDVEFEKAFEVYGDDQIESRYLLTTSFMSRLLEYRNKKRCSIEVVFLNDTNLNENVFFFMHTNRNHFEIPVMKTLLNKDIFYDVIMDIVDAMEIVDALKLDQNIGL